MQHFPKALVFCMIAVAVPVAAQNQTVPTAVADQNPNSNLPQMKVGPGDLLGIQVYDAPEFTRTARITDDGNLRLPMLKQQLPVKDLMPNDIEILLSDALKREGLFVDPFVTVSVVEYHSRPVNVAGAVRTPTIFQAIGTVRLLDAIARAGGLVPDQAGPEIIVTRPNGDTGTPVVQRIPVKPLLSGADPSLNITLVGGEDIRVPDVEKFIVAGSVVKPGPYPVLDGNANTVITAIAQAQGTVQFFSHTAYIYRPDSNNVLHEIPVDLGKILARKKPDVTIQAKDILWVPDSSRRRITQNTINSITGMGSAATSAAIYVLR